jgi:HEAT repeat protein
MGLKCTLPAIVAASMLALPAAAGVGQEPFWDSKPLSYWVTALSAQDPHGRVRAASSLAQMAIAHGGSAVASAVPGLLPNLADPVAEVRESAAHALEQIGAPAARPAVATLLGLMSTDATAQVRRRAALALGRIEPTAEDVITGAARTLRDDQDMSVRESAAVLLMASGRSAGRVSNALSAALTDDSHAVRLYSAAALAKTAEGHSAFPRLLDVLQDDDAALRAEAVGLLVEAGRGREEVMSALVRALADSNAEVRGAAADALGSLGKPARPVLPALWPLLRDPDETVRDRVLRAVRAIRRG